jgi:hypothetical protein
VLREWIVAGHNGVAVSIRPAPLDREGAAQSASVTISRVMSSNVEVIVMKTNVTIAP